MELSKCLHRYGTILKDLDDGTDRVLIFSYDGKLWYERWSCGELLECHQLRP